jgi:uroporphyrinogen decarboxylase
MHGARELGMSIKDYFSKAENVVEGQIRMQKKYSNDYYNPFFYAALEVEAFGAEVIFSDDGPPNTGRPFLNDINGIRNFHPPKIKEAKVLHKMLKAIELLKEKSKGTMPIIGVVMSPFSLPVMQLGFEKYLEIMHFEKELWTKLMHMNEVFCIEWANAQLAAGANAICYFDPVSSTTIIPKEMYAETGFQIARRTLSKIKGATATHFASGICLPIADMIMETGTAAVGVSVQEDIMELKKVFRNKVTVIGNLNGVEMRRWTPEKTYRNVEEVIRKAAPDGGFILSDNHGELPFQVSEDTLLTVSEAVKHVGAYPIINKDQS